MLYGLSLCKRILRKVKVLAKKIFLSILFLCFWNVNTHAVEMTEEFDVAIGVFDAATVRFVYNEKQGNFDIVSEVETANLFQKLYRFLGQYRSVGRFEKNKTLPLKYETFTETSRHLRQKQILYDALGKAYKRISTKDDATHETAIENVPQTADSADLQTVFAELVHQFQKTGSCALKREIYDGKKHYRVVSENKSKARRYSFYTQAMEDMQQCGIFIENLKDNNDNILWDVSADKPIVLWVMHEKSTNLPIIDEITIDSTPLGALKVTPKKMTLK